MNNSAARACAALLAVCAAAMPVLALASEILQNPGGEALADEQSAFLRVPAEDLYGVAVYVTEFLAVGTSAGQWTEIDDMRVRRSPTGYTILRVPGDDLVVRLAPGSYQLRANCNGHEAEHLIDAHPLEVVAGREYLVECLGRDMSAARLRIAEQAVQAPGAARPLRHALIDMPAGFEAPRIGEAIKAALANRGWQVTGEEPGHIDARIQLRKHAATVRIDYDPREVVFTYIDSVNLDHEVVAGVTYIHRNYYNWIHFLASDIGLDLAGQPLTQ